MSVLKVTISSARPSTFLTQNFETTTGSHAVAQRLLAYINGVQTGTEGPHSSTVPPTIAFAIQENQAQATGTITFGGVGAANDTVLINGVTFTAQASGATGNQWNVGATATLSAAALAAAINASVTALVSGYVTAANVAGVLTITSAFYGTSGNQCTIAKGVDSLTAMTVSGARLTGGSEDATASSLTF
jgi:hypothetical protein